MNTEPKIQWRPVGSCFSNEHQSFEITAYTPVCKGVFYKEHTFLAVLDGKDSFIQYGDEKFNDLPDTKTFRTHWHSARDIERVKRKVKKILLSELQYNQPRGNSRAE